MSLHIWTTEHDDLIRRRISERATRSQIAAELGHGITRNMVVGRAHRLGIVSPPKQPADPLVSSPGPTPAPVGRSLPAMTAPAPEQPWPVPICEPITIADLREDRCHWPLGDPRDDSFRYCGQPRLIDGRMPYCARHVEAAVQPRPERMSAFKKKAMEVSAQ